jgi:hypothetical protein
MARTIGTLKTRHDVLDTTRMLVSRCQRYIETVPWDERVLQHDRQFDRICLVVVAAAAVILGLCCATALMRVM